jgi:MarR family transcriptional regulator, transcriptional regulator for hemolysin
MEPCDPLRTEFLMDEVARLQHNTSDNYFRALGITRSQWRLLSRVRSQGDRGTTQIELADLLNRGANGIGALIDRIKGRFVEREADPKDRRIYRIRITKSGDLVFSRGATVDSALDSKILRGISIERQRQLSATLQLMLRNLVAMVPLSSNRRDRAGKRARSDRPQMESREF